MTMKRAAAALALMLFPATLPSAAFAQAQTPKSDYDTVLARGFTELHQDLKVGERIVITDVNGTNIKGRISTSPNPPLSWVRSTSGTPPERAGPFRKGPCGTSNVTMASRTGS
jgi:hypothetical protein